MDHDGRKSPASPAGGGERGSDSRVGLALRDLGQSRPVRTVRALLLRAGDLRDRAREVARGTVAEGVVERVLDRVGRRRADDGGATPTERVRGLDGAVTIARDRFGIPGVFATTRADAAFGMGWACSEDRLFQMELSRRALRGELAATFGDRPVDEKQTTRMMAGRTFFDLDAFVRAVGFRAAAEASYEIASAEGRAWVDAYAAGVNAYLASGRRPLEMLLLDIEPAPWTGADSLLVAKGMAFQLTFSYRFALAWALVDQAVDPKRAARLRPIRHPLSVTRGDVGALEPLMATTEVLRAVLGADGVHLGSNAFAIAGSRTTTGRPIVSSDPHMPLTAPAVFWECRARGGDVDVRGASVPGLPAFPIGQNEFAAWGATAGWGDDAQLYREDLAQLRRDGRLRTRSETITIKGGGTRTIELLATPRGPIVSHVIGSELLSSNGSANGQSHGLALRWSGQDATLDADAALGLIRMRSFDDLKAAVRNHGGPTLNFVFADREGHIGWHYAGRIPRRAGNVSGLDIVDGDDPRGAFRGYVPPEELPHLLDPKDGIIVSANTRPHGDGYRYALGELFEPPFRNARIRALLDALSANGAKISPDDVSRLQRDVRSAWALHMRDALLEGLDDGDLGLTPRRGGEVLKLMRAWSGYAVENSTGAAATYVFLEAVIRHLFLEDLGELAFERYFEIMNVSALSLLQVLGQGLGGEAVEWLEGRDRATIVADAAAMAEGRLRRLLGDDPAQWRWGALHTITFRHAFHDVPGLKAISSPGPYAGRGDGTTVCMGEYDLRGGSFAVRVGPALRFVMHPGAPWEGRGVMPPGNSGDPTSKHYRDQATLYLDGGLRDTPWDETEFTERRMRLAP